MIQIDFTIEKSFSFQILKITLSHVLHLCYYTQIVVFFIKFRISLLIDSKIMELCFEFVWTKKCMGKGARNGCFDFIEHYCWHYCQQQFKVFFKHSFVFDFTDILSFIFNNYFQVYVEVILLYIFTR